MVSPDGVKDEDEIFNKRISDGFEYVLDANGNVMKDTAGNDIKLQKFKDITCTLIETQQFKSVEIRGEVEITFHESGTADAERTLWCIQSV